MCCKNRGCAFATLDGEVMFRTNHFIAIEKRDKSGLLIVSKRHVAHFEELLPSELSDLQRVRAKVKAYFVGRSIRFHDNEGSPLRKVGDHFHVHVSTYEMLQKLVKV